MSATYQDPTAKMVKDFLSLAEGSDNGIYYDAKNNGYPTHGIGVRLDDKTDKFLTDYINSFYKGTKYNSEYDVDHYEFIDNQWVVKGKKTIFAELKYLLNNRAGNPLAKDTDYPEKEVRLFLKIEDYTFNDVKIFNERAFSEVAYFAYLGGTDDGYNIVGVKDIIKEDVWCKLTTRERLALYSLNYNSPTGSRAYIGPKILNALRLYTQSSDDAAKIIGKLGIWYEILYGCNSEDDSINKGIQNRRFYEANEFLELDYNKKPNDIEGKSVFTVKTLVDAQIAIAFMNMNKTAMYNKLLSITGYKTTPYKYMRDNFSSAVNVFLANQNYKNKPKIDTLFEEWNLQIDLTINTTDGTTDYANIAGDDKRAAFFITAKKNGMTVDAKGGNDDVFGGSYEDVVYSGSGNDVIYTFGGKDVVYTNDGTATDSNTVFLGAGSDFFYGGDGKDIVDGGSGAIGAYINSNFEGTDSNSDVNTIHLGGGDDGYTGDKGVDIVYTGSGNDTVKTGAGDDIVYANEDTLPTDVKRVWLGGGSDEYRGGEGNDIVDGGYGTYDDKLMDINTVYLGNGNNRYTGGIGTDQVYSGDGADVISTGGGNDYIEAGAGADNISPGTGHDTVDCGVDNVKDWIMVGGDSSTETTIINYGKEDAVSCTGGIAGREVSGNDEILYGKNGNKIILKGAAAAAKSRGANSNMPLIYQPSGQVLQWNGNAYVDSGKRWPAYEDHPDEATLAAIEKLEAKAVSK